MCDLLCCLCLCFTCTTEKIGCPCCKRAKLDDKKGKPKTYVFGVICLTIGTIIFGLLGIFSGFKMLGGT